jgi:aspartyl-tRNA(Asn)/glutamyl-tRNA(Gln) amidotransferase subunit A
MTTITDLTIAEAAAELKRGEISPVELVEFHLEQIEALDGSINAFITVTAEAALDDARQAGTEISRGEWRGLLHGIPIALKDLYDTRAVRTTAGSTFFSDRIPEADAHAVQKLKQAGAVLLGKLNMHEIALGVTNENPHFGDCRNPWAPDRVSGGSSGGSAAALAAGMCMGSLGSDTGGSIRIPASLCGVVGLKPTYGRVSLRGVLPLSWNLDHAGPMARTVQDAAILLQTVAGYDPQDPASVNVPVDDYLKDIEAGIQGWRIALGVGEFFEQAIAEVIAAVEEAARVLADLGGIVRKTPLPGVLEAAQANGLMVTSDAAAFHRERLRDNPQGFGEDVLQRLQSGAAYTSTEYILARRTQSELRRQFDLFFEDCDLLLMPATPVPAPIRASAGPAERAPQLTRFTAPFNLIGLPALVLPCGFSSAGLPIGLQMVGPPWSEAAIFRAGMAFEKASGWYRHKPPILQKPAGK